MRIFWILIVLLIPIGLIAQEKQQPMYLNSAYLELGGSGLWYSLNYDRVFHRGEKTAVTGRVGFSYFGSLDSAGLTFPISCSFLYGKKRNFLELGGGPSTLYAPSANITGIAAMGIIGFRHQRLDKRGFMYRVVFNPFIGEYSTDKGYWNWVFMPWGGVSLGWGF